jgi:hypothetical protein
MYVSVLYQFMWDTTDVCKPTVDAKKFLYFVRGVFVSVCMYVSVCYVCMCVHYRCMQTYSWCEIVLVFLLFCVYVCFSVLCMYVRHYRYMQAYTWYISKMIREIMFVSCSRRIRLCVCMYVPVSYVCKHKVETYVRWQAYTFSTVFVFVCVYVPVLYVCKPTVDIYVRWKYSFKHVFVSVCMYVYSIVYM